VVALETHEETRLTQIIKEIMANEHRSVYVWSAASGFRDAENRLMNIMDMGSNNVPSGLWSRANKDQKSTENDDQPVPMDMMTALEAIRAKKLNETFPDGEATGGNIFVMLDPHAFMQTVPIIQRKIRDIVPVLKGQRKIVIMISPTVNIPTDLQKVVSIIDMPLPSADEIESILCNAIKGLSDQEQTRKDAVESLKGDPEKAKSNKAMLSKLQQKKKILTDQVEKEPGKDAIVAAALGLTLEECENVFAKCLIQGDLNLKTIIAEKKQIIKKSGLLEYWEPSETANSIGGLGALKRHIRSVSRRFGKKAKAYGIDPPRGIMLVGIPGSGKSLVAKACANELHLPLLRLDMAQLVSKFYGESSNNMRSVWKLAKALSPCILWVDEIEKALGAGQNGEMHEESARLFGSFLTEMEESNGVYVVATCNDHLSLKAELMSRFPKIYFVNAPTTKERREIFDIHLRAIGRKPEKFDLDGLAAASKGFVGREIRNILQDALGNAFDEEKELSTAHILPILKVTKPITEQKKEKLAEMIEWAGKYAIPASDDFEETVDAHGAEETKSRAQTIDLVNKDDLLNDLK
jgi:ATP-dependent 26S proteasome regulatory subunit